MTQYEPLDTAPTPVKLRVEDYLLLDDAGAFEGFRTELLDGQIFRMNSQHRPHARVKSRLHFLLCQALRDRHAGLEALVEASLSNPPHNAPEPDIVVTSDPEGTGLVPYESVALIVEVADTTLASDQTKKLRIYAAAGVPEYWVVDVNGRAIHQHWIAAGDGYRERRTIGFGDPIAAQMIAGLTVETNGL